MLLKALCECSGAPGGEKEVRQYIAAELERIGCPYEIDNLGNVIAHHPGKSGEQKVLFAAHMDEPALMICDVTERGFLRFKAVGTRVTTRQLSSRTVRVGENVMGVVGFAPYHMMRITDEQKRRSAENQHIDIAAESKERALERIQIGSAEVDFIATTADEKKYVQVTESMMSEDVRKRELAPLQSIRDNYEKIVLSLEPGLDASYDGIKSENLIDWLLSE